MAFLSLCTFTGLAACGGGGSPSGTGSAVPVPITTAPGGGTGDNTGGSPTENGGAPAPTPVKVSVYRPFEKAVTNVVDYANKFTDVALNVHYTSPSGRQLDFPGFYDGDGAGGQDGNVWKFRFMPDELGTWKYSYSWSDDTAGGSGEFVAVSDNAGPGVLRAYGPNPHWFAYNGTVPVFLKSYNVGAAGFTGVPIDWAATNVYSKLVARGYNHVMLKSLPIGWTNEKPSDAPADHIDRPLWRDTPLTQDLGVWRRFEEHMRWLNEHNVGVHFFMGFDPKGDGAPDAFFALKRWNDLPADEQDFYVRYVTARLAPYANVAGWNYTWETDGSTGERRLMDLLAKYDPWKHLGTYHDEQPAANSYDDSRYGFAGIENHGYFGNSGGAVALDSASHYQATRDAYRNKPVYMVEGNGLWRACWANDSAAGTTTRAAWAVTLAGGSFTWEDTGGCFDGPMSDMLNWPSSNPIANRLDALYKVMTQDVAFQRMEPHNELLGSCWSSFNPSGAVPTSPCYALAEIGSQYVVYKEDGGTFSLNLAAGNYAATWVDTHTGARQSTNGVQGGGAPLSFTAPSTSTDWVLVLKSAG